MKEGRGNYSIDYETVRHEGQYGSARDWDTQSVLLCRRESVKGNA